MRPLRPTPAGIGLPLAELILGEEISLHCDGSDHGSLWEPDSFLWKLCGLQSKPCSVLDLQAFEKA